MADTYEVFVGKTSKNRNKSYFVAKDMSVANKAAKRSLKVTEDHILIQVAWTVGDDLYFNNPHKRGQKKVWAASYLA